MKFHERLKDIRKSRGFTQETLAHKIGVTPGAIGLYEQGRREPDNETVLKLAQSLNVSVDFLLGEDVPVIIARYNNATPQEITLDDFTYAMFQEMKDLTEQQKTALLQMAKTLNNSTFNSNK